jgi:hypothetical protein
VVLSSQKASPCVTALLLCLSFAGLRQNEEAVPRLKLAIQKELLVQGNIKGPIQYPIRCDQQP